MKKYKETKKIYSQEYRKTHKDEIQAYEKKTEKQRNARNEARKLIPSANKGEQVRHKDGNPLNNSKSNLFLTKKRTGGVKGNSNRKK